MNEISPFSTELTRSEQNAIINGEIVPAIKSYRTRTNSTLKFARDTVMQFKHEYEKENAEFSLDWDRIIRILTGKEEYISSDNLKEQLTKVILYALQMRNIGGKNDLNVKIFCNCFSDLIIGKYTPIGVKDLPITKEIIELLNK